MFKKHVTKFTPKDNQQPSPLTAVQVAKAYNFPPGISLEKQAVAVIELGGGYLQSDINLYCNRLGVIHPQMEWVGVDGAVDNLFPSDPDVEVQLDQCVIAAVAPGVKIYTVFAPNAGNGFADAIVKACSLPVSAISISWGGPESSWDQPSIDAMEKAFQLAKSKGIGVYAAAGDNGSDDGVGDGQNHTDYPASSPNVVACGGTRLELDSNGKRVFEKVWSLSDGNGSTGGGISSVFPGRKVPDVAGNADPASGYQIKADFVNQTVGGTSAVAPLYAALHVILQSYFPTPIGDLREVFASLSSGEVFDVTEGSNGAFSATVGPDECTGIGVVDGTAVLHHLVASGQLQKVAADLKLEVVL